MPDCRAFTEGAAYANWHTTDGNSQVVVEKVGNVDPAEDPSLMYALSVDFPGFRVAFSHHGVVVACNNPDGSWAGSTTLNADIGDVVEVRYNDDVSYWRFTDGGRWQSYTPLRGPHA